MKKKKLETKRSLSQKVKCNIKCRIDISMIKNLWHYCLALKMKLNGLVTQTTALISKIYSTSVK